MSLPALAVFFTRNVSLQIWVETGLFDREKILYEEHLKANHFASIYWLTYGKGDRALASRLRDEGKLHPGIHICPMPRCFSGKPGILLYSLLLPIIHTAVLRRCDLLKTNQMDGAWAALIAKILFRKPLLVRTGFVLTQLETQLRPHRKLRNAVWGMVERLVYGYADRISLSAEHSRRYVSRVHGLAPRSIDLIPNFIDTELFSPDESVTREDRIVFVGRLSSVKNLFALIDAAKTAAIPLDIYGAGELREELERHVIARQAPVIFMGTLPNHELPAVLRRYRYAALVSRQEGMPKTLVEAMACGCCCIGTNVEGINEIIEDGITGILATDTGAAGIAQAIGRAQAADSDMISQRGVAAVRGRYALPAILQKEQDLFQNMLTNSGTDR